MTMTPIARDAVKALAGNPAEQAKIFHVVYEALAPRFGYETRQDTREFNEETPNGKLMTAVCDVVMTPIMNALLAALDDLDAVKAERDKWHDLAASNGRAALDELAQVVAAEARAEAAEAANAAMTAREGVLRAFIDDFATAKIDALRYQPSYGESPEDEPDPVVDATEVWAWQSDAKDILALKETPDA